MKNDEFEKIATLARRFTIDELQAHTKVVDDAIDRMDAALLHPGVAPEEFLRVKAAMGGKKGSQ